MNDIKRDATGRIGEMGHAQILRQTLALDNLRK
jgi:hypothetical protein